MVALFSVHLRQLYNHRVDNVCITLVQVIRRTTHHFSQCSVNIKNNSLWLTRSTVINRLLLIFTEFPEHLTQNINRNSPVTTILVTLQQFKPWHIEYLVLNSPVVFSSEFDPALTRIRVQVRIRDDHAFNRITAVQDSTSSFHLHRSYNAFTLLRVLVFITSFKSHNGCTVVIAVDIEIARVLFNVLASPSTFT